MRTKKELRPYQDRIATHLYEHNEALCVLRPGGGKTVSALTAIGELLHDEIIRHALVIAPKRVAQIVWPDEIEEWKHLKHLRYQIVRGDPRKRAQAVPVTCHRDLMMIGLDLTQWLMEEVDKLPDDHPVFDLLVIDEISKMRDPKGKRAKALAKRLPRWRMVWGLSGTLRPNSALDLFMPARLVTRGKLWGRSFYQWRKTYFYQTDFMGYDWSPLPGSEEKLNEQLAPLTVMVPEGEMPTVTPTIVFDKVELPPEARREYDKMQRLLMAQIEGDEVIAASAAVATGKLAQIANGFLYMTTGSTVDTPVHSAKLEWLRELIEDTTEPTLLIYDFVADLEMIKYEIRHRTGEELRYLGAGVSDKQAAANIADWNAGKLKFMGLHPASGGHGLNLQHGGANMAWVSPIWSPELWEQTIARIARSGQKRPVVVRVCTAINTVDEMKIDRVHHKMTAQAAFEAWMKRWHKEKAA
jgi:SNF2 family DNA or RNA helicase